MTRVVWSGLNTGEVERVSLRGRKRAKRNRASWYRAGKCAVHTTVGGAGETERALRRKK